MARIKKTPNGKYYIENDEGSDFFNIDRLHILKGLDGVPIEAVEWYNKVMLNFHHDYDWDKVVRMWKNTKDLYDSKRGEQ